MRLIKQILLRNKSLLTFLLANYVDKGLVFLLPIVLLYVVHDKQTYNDLEYIYSLASVVVPLFSSISSYAFYGYKISLNRGEFISKYSTYSSLTIATVLMIAILCVSAVSAYGVVGYSIGICIVIRLVYLLYTQYFANYYRLQNRPIVIVFQSLLCSIISLILILLCSQLVKKGYLFCVFIPQLITTLYFLSYKKINKHVFFEYLSFIIKTIKYSFPVIINCTIVAFVMNYGKIYAYNFLTQDDMYIFSITMRISMIMSLSNSAFIAFFGKDIYISGYTKSILAKYILFLLTSFICALIIILVLNMVGISGTIEVSITTFLLLLYTLLHCLGAFLEMYFGKSNNNIYLLYSSVITCLFFLFLIFVIGVKSIDNLALYMLLYSIIYCLLLIIKISYRICQK
jgi:hypothetical protein